MIKNEIIFSRQNAVKPLNDNRVNNWEYIPYSHPLNVEN